jgi:hypothetical protein
VDCWALTKLVVESALEGEMDDHLGRAARSHNGENSRNGKRAKSVLTEAGPVEIAVPGIGIPRSSRRSSPRGSGACPVLMIW